MTERSKGSVYKPVHIKQEEMVASNKVQTDTACSQGHQHYLTTDR